MRPGILTLTTDFGTDSPYVAAMKGVVLGLAPGSQLVDVTHAIAPQDLVEGSFILAEVIDAFPSGTVHLAVVDPGVGTDRRLVVVQVAGQWFVLPDNGLISGVLEGRGVWNAWAIRNPKLRREFVSSTFHGRDILAPVAAHLLVGGDPFEVGPKVEDLIRLEPIGSRQDGEHLEGEVVYVDSFGNLITNIMRANFGELDSWSVEIGDRTVGGLIATYAERSPGSLVALVGSSGRVEVAVVNGHAESTLGATRGTAVALVRTKGSVH